MASVDEVHTEPLDPSGDAPTVKDACETDQASSTPPAEVLAGGAESPRPVKSPVLSTCSTPDITISHSQQSSAPARPSSHSEFANPPPRRFNVVIARKRFLHQVTPSNSARPETSEHQNSSKSGSPALRPIPQSSNSHCRLVTAKLTSNGPQSTPSGSGWSRPSSATPPASSTNTASSNLPSSQPLASAPTTPQLSLASKIVQPQPLSAITQAIPPTRKSGSPAKLAWATSKPTPGVSFLENARDFPTAAEVAQRRTAKTEDNKADGLSPSKPAAAPEADAFRGVHLDPNAHHWDEMAEDDDNFLENVIEFGDGRQYTIAPTEVDRLPSTQADSTAPPASERISHDAMVKEDRFVDDFDRSWPRSKFSTTVSSRDFSSRSSRQPSVSPASSQPSHSPLQDPRTLFNERSNRLEPYSAHPPSRFPGVLKKDGRSEPFHRDSPPHHPAHHIHALQKPTESGYNVSARSIHSYSSDIPRNRRYSDRELAPPSGLGSRLTQSRMRVKDTTTLPGTGLDSVRSIGEVRSQHASNGTHVATGMDNALSSEASHVSDNTVPQDARLRGSPLQPSSTPPEVSGDQVVIGPTAISSPQQSMLLELDVDSVHKTAMHISAERARERRQREEEEREKEKERARKKGLELEERMRAAEASKIQPQEVTAVEIIEEVASSVQVTKSPVSEARAPLSPSRSSMAERTPSLRAIARPPREARFSRFVPPDHSSSVADQVDSWRSRSRVLAPQVSSSPWSTISALPFLNANEDLVTDAAKENLEVVDYSDLGKFFGVERASSPSQSRSVQRGRAVAADYFEDSPSSKDLAETQGQEVSAQAVETSTVDVGERSTHERRHSSTQSGSAINTTSDGFISVSSSGHLSYNRPYKTVPIEVLDDVMSRIRGALNDMQVDSAKDVLADSHVGLSNLDHHPMKPRPSGITKSLSKEGKWLPPAIRSQPTNYGNGQEDFGVTGYDPSHSPRQCVVVKLPQSCRPIEANSKRQIRMSKHYESVRWDILSWDPPVEGMSRRDFTLNDVLFRKSKKDRYQVTLPKSAAPNLANGPRVHLPNMFLRTSPLSGRSKASSDLPSWRRGHPSSSTDQKAEQATDDAPCLDVTSCSPPPEPFSRLPEPKMSEDTSVRTDKQSARSRAQPKLPPGSAIGFYRDPSSPTRHGNNAVNFIVTSELERTQHSPQPESSTTALPIVPGSLLVMSGDLKDPLSVEDSEKVVESSITGLTPQTESKSSEESVERSLLTPASGSFGTPWTKSPLSFSAKDSPARAPDPEHLKAVWSQATEREPIPAINSLEGIADDLTLPFTIQDVKSEDGETPPPISSAIPSKMSIHDVTRAFQQVPPSSSSSHRPALSPALASGLIARPLNSNYSTPNMPGRHIQQPLFLPPSMVVSNSPTTYANPMTQINGPSPAYPPHWIPMQGSQNRSGTMRPIASPYPAQMMPYPAPSPVPHMYGIAPSNQNPSTSVNGVMTPRGIPMMSPSMHPSAPPNMQMYGGSPIMMHPMPSLPPGQPPYNSAPTPRRAVHTNAVVTSPLMPQSLPQNQLPQYGHGPPPHYWC